MDRKTNFLFGGILIAVLSAQFVHTLDCYFCQGRNCTDLEAVTCNEKIANETNNFLENYFAAVPNITSNQFECLWLNRTRIINDNVTRVEIRSCVYRETKACNLYAYPGTGSTIVTCSTCRSDLCNKWNSAATFANSKIVFALSVLSVFIMKELKS